MKVFVTLNLWKKNSNTTSKKILKTTSRYQTIIGG